MNKAAIAAAKNDKNTYLTEYQGHKILVAKTSRGKGYSPFELLAQGKTEEAARIAAAAFAANL